MKYRAVISDLDGTLLDENHMISEETKKIVKQIVDLGVKFIIATGRYHTDSMIFKQILDLKGYIITSNGARIHDYDDKVIFSKDIPVELSNEIFDIRCDEEIHKNVYVDEGWYVEKPLKDALKFHKESGFIYDIKLFSELKGKQATKFFFISENQEKLFQLEEQLKNRYSNQLNITLSLNTCLEMMYNGISKAEAVKEVLKREGISLEETIAFGDGLNDYEILATTTSYTFLK